MSKSITALYQDRSAASQAIDSLRAKGFMDKDLSILMSDKTQGKEFAIKPNTKAPEGTSTGAAVGGAIGAVVAGLTAVGTITLTGGAGLVAAGPVIAALAGAGAGGAAGGLVGGLVGLGFDEDEAKLVENDLENGSILVAAESPDDQASETKDLFNSTGARRVTVH